MLTTPEILRRAANEVRAGWVRHIRHDGKGDVCALGALENALLGSRQCGMRYDGIMASHSLEFSHAAKALAALLPRTRHCSEMRIAQWNNGADQTAENVAATMELAAICVEQAQEQAPATNAVDPGVQSITESLRA